MDDLSTYCDSRVRRIEEMNYGLMDRPALRTWAWRRAQKEAHDLDLHDEKQRAPIHHRSGAAQSDPY